MAKVELIDKDEITHRLYQFINEMNRGDVRVVYVDERKTDTRISMEIEISYD